MQKEGVFLHSERELLTLKPVMVPLPACLSASLTQVMMVSSLTFCPSPRSSKMLSVYLQTEDERVDLKRMIVCLRGSEAYEHVFACLTSS